jgi:hypothetical protein
VPPGVRTRYSGQSRLKTARLGAHRPEDVGAQRVELEAHLRQQADVDAAVVVALDQHRVLVRLAADLTQQHAREVTQRMTGLGLDDREDVGIQLLDHARRVLRGDLIDGLRLQLDPAQPVAAAARNDLDRVVLMAEHERIRARSSSYDALRKSTLISACASIAATAASLSALADNATARWKRFSTLHDAIFISVTGLWLLAERRRHDLTIATWAVG